MNSARRGAAILRPAALFVALTCAGVYPTVAATSPSQTSRPPTTSDLQQALDRALSYFSRHVTHGDPRWTPLFIYLHRRYAVNLALPDNSAALGRIYARLSNPTATVTRAEIAALPTVIDRIVASALHCDRIPVPAQWPRILGELSRKGGYALTHAALATRWSVENGCLNTAAAQRLKSLQTGLLRKMVITGARLDNRFQTSIDLWLEALALLRHVDATQQLPADVTTDLVALQRTNGGWPAAPGTARSDPHASALAVWAILQARHPGSPDVAWIPRTTLPAATPATPDPTP